MRRFLMAALIVFFMAVPVQAAEWTAPEVPDSAVEWMPESPVTFTDGVLELLGRIIPSLHPAMTEAIRTCLAIVGAVLLISTVRNMHTSVGKTADLAGVAVIGILLLGASNSMIALGAKTVQEISDYGKLLIPVMTSAMAAGGGITASAALYLGTAFFDSVLSTAISALLIPLIYVLLALSAANSALGDDLLKQMKDFVKWLVTWALKTILYVFTAYMGITGVISGTTDAAAMKAAKLTISGVVPVVGGILSDASEAVLVGADTVRNSVGIYGLLAVLAIWIGPFLQIGIHYLTLKLTGAVCGIFGSKGTVGLIHDFTGAMGLLLAMTGSVCLMLLVSTVCFMKGVG